SASKARTSPPGSGSTVLVSTLAADSNGTTCATMKTRMARMLPMMPSPPARTSSPAMRSTISRRRARARPTATGAAGVAGPPSATPAGGIVVASVEITRPSVQLGQLLGVGLAEQRQVPILHHHLLAVARHDIEKELLDQRIERLVRCLVHVHV